MSQGFDPAALQAAYRQVEEGDPRMRAIRQAIAEAEQAQDFHAQIVFHRDLIKESVFTGDRYQALIDFPQYYALYENHEELRDVHRYNVIWTFKWILEAATEFPQIPKNQIVQWFSQFRKNCAVQATRSSRFITCGRSFTAISIWRGCAWITRSS